MVCLQLCCLTLQVANKFLENTLGVTVDNVTIGKNANLDSLVTDFTPEQWNQFQKHISDTYEQFVSKVAEGRKMSKEKVKEIGGGRIYTGDIAKDIGLVDELGGLTKAIDVAKVIFL
jgi:protease-4